MCERQKQTYGMSAHKSRSFVNMFAGQWSLPLSKRYIDSIRPNVLVKLSCRLCRLVPFLFAVRNPSDAPFGGTTCFRQHGLDAAVLFAPTCSSLFHIDCRAHAQQTRFYDKHCNRTCGAVPNMLDLRRRSSFPIPFRCGKIQLATAQNCFVRCVVVRVRDDVDGVQLWTQPRSTMVTPHPHAVTVLRKKGVDVTSHDLGRFRAAVS